MRICKKCKQMVALSHICNGKTVKKCGHDMDYACGCNALDEPRKEVDCLDFIESQRYY